MAEKQLEYNVLYIYILKSKAANKTYVGYAKDIARRLAEHNRGKVRATKAYKPFEIVHVDKFQTENEAKDKELYYKTTSGRRQIKKFLVGRGG